MQLIRPFVALLCAISISASPTQDLDQPALYGKIKRASSSSTAAVTEKTTPDYDDWVQIAGKKLDAGVHIFEAKEPRNTAVDATMPAVAVAGMNYVNANHYALVAVTVTATQSGPPKARINTTGASANYWDLVIKQDTKPEETVLGHSGSAWKLNLGATKGVTYTYVKKAKSNKFSDINTPGKILLLLELLPSLLVALHYML